MWTSLESLWHNPPPLPSPPPVQGITCMENPFTTVSEAEFGFAPWFGQSVIWL